MKKLDIARAWRDEDYYLTLTEAERASLPANPAAAINVTDDSLRTVSGAKFSATGTAICSPCPHVNCD